MLQSRIQEFRYNRLHHGGVHVLNAPHSVAHTLSFSCLCVVVWKD